MKTSVSTRVAKAAFVALVLIPVAGCRSSGAVSGGAPVPQPERNRTTSVGVISERDLETISPTDLSTTIESRVPGVNVVDVGGDLRVLIRGVSTFSGAPYALVVIDGVVGSLSMVNPRDIASIRILKDASAAFYGSRGANGVLLITTKRGPRR